MECAEKNRQMAVFFIYDSKLKSYKVNVIKESKVIKVGIVGGTGYTGVELLRLLALHPQVELRTITSRADAGMPSAKCFQACADIWI